MYGTLKARTNGSTLSMRWKTVSGPSAPRRAGPSNRLGHKPGAEGRTIDSWTWTMKATRQRQPRHLEPVDNARTVGDDDVTETVSEMLMIATALRPMLIGVFFVVLAGATSAQKIDRNDPLWQKALALHHDAVVVDTHSDLTSRMLKENVAIGERLKDGHQDIPRMIEGGLDVEFFSVYVAAGYAKRGALKRALEMIDVVYDACERWPDKMEMAYTVADIRRIMKAKKIAALMGLEGGHALENSPRVLRRLYQLGIRYVTLTHSNTNGWADSISDQPKWGGLNELGESMIREMNRIGMMADISHVSDETFFDVMKVTKAPVIASHSSCRAVAPMQRNMTDPMLKALAKNGGVVQINFGSAFVSKKWGECSAFILEEIKTKHKGNLAVWSQMWRRLNKADPLPNANLDDILAHIEHAVRVAGPKHVGLGSDFDGVGNIPDGMEDCTKLPWITYHLLKRGHSAETIRGILGENLLRVMREVENVSAKLTRTK